MTIDLITKLQSVDLDAMAKRAYVNAKRHGFHNGDMEINHWLCLVICELSEAVEADRYNKRALPEAFYRAMKEPVSPHEAASPEEIYDYWFKAYIKDTVEDELADAAIRLLDLAGSMDVLINEAYTKYQRVYVCNFAESWSFTEKIFSIEQIIVGSKFVSIPDILYQIYCLADSLGFDLFEYIERKMTYNEHRPFKHGKEY